MRRSPGSAPVVLMALAALVTAPAASAAPLTWGVLNQQSAALTAERWNPVLHHVTGITGVPLQLRMGATVSDTNAMMGAGQLDFVFTNHNFRAEYDGLGYKVIARWAGEPIHSVIAVAESSPIERLAQLEGRPVAFPSRDAFVGYAVPVVALRKARISVEEVFGGNQEGALAQLKAGRVAAAAVNSRFLTQYMEREGVRFREIYVSEGYPDLAVIVHPRVPAVTVDRVRQALIGLRNDPAAAPILARVKFTGFEPATDRDYDGVRRVYRQVGQVSQGQR